MYHAVDITLLAENVATRTTKKLTYHQLFFPNRQYLQFSCKRHRYDV
jgi:hypothetical protein